MTNTVIFSVVQYDWRKINDWKRKENKGEPVARYFIKLIENNDYKNLCSCKSFLGDHQGKDDYSANFALILAILTVLNNINNKGKRIYEKDIQIDRKECKNLFVKSNLMKIKLNNEKLTEFHQFILTHYVSDDTTPNGAIYHFHPKFFYKKEVVDTFFAYLLWQNETEKSIETIAQDNNLLYKKAIEKTIISFCKKNKE